MSNIIDWKKIELRPLESLPKTGEDFSLSPRKSGFVTYLPAPQEADKMVDHIRGMAWSFGGICYAVIDNDFALCMPMSIGRSEVIVLFNAKATRNPKCAGVVAPCRGEYVAYKQGSVYVI